MKKTLLPRDMRTNKNMGARIEVGNGRFEGSLIIGMGRGMLGL